MVHIENIDQISTKKSMRISGWSRKSPQKKSSVLLKTVKLHKAAVLPKNIQPFKNSSIYPLIDLLHERCSASWLDSSNYS